MKHHAIGLECANIPPGSFDGLVCSSLGRLLSDF
jgi:hypothetical protein